MIAKFPYVTLSEAKGLTAQGGILRFAQNDRQRFSGGQAGMAERGDGASRFSGRATAPADSAGAVAGDDGARGGLSVLKVLEVEGVYEVGEGRHTLQFFLFDLGAALAGGLAFFGGRAEFAGFFVQLDARFV